MRVMHALAAAALLIGAVAAAAVPAQAAQAGIDGYVWGHQPNNPDYFPNTGYEHNSAGGPVQIIRTGVGAYRVIFHGMAGPGGVAHASAYGSGDLCTVAGYGPRGGDEIVLVRCFHPNGKPVDSRFVANVANRQPAAAAFGYLRNDRPVPPAAGYTPPTQRWYDSTGQPVVIHRTAPGRYEVELGAYAQDSGGEWMDVFLTATPFAAAARHCQVMDPTFVPDPTRLYVRCYDDAGLGVDTGFTLTYARGVSPLGTFSGHATATVERYAGSPVVQGWSNTFSGGGALASDLDTWSYLVTFRDTAQPRGHAVASIMGTPPMYCNIHAWWTDGEHQYVWLRCYQNDGAPQVAVQYNVGLMR
jgi:hypothetical protein